MTLWPPGWDSDHLEHDRMPVPPGEAAQRLRRRNTIINMALALYPLAATVAAAALAFAYIGANHRADRVARSVTDIARFDNQARAYVACLGDPACPTERREFLRRLLADDVTRSPGGDTPGVPPATRAPGTATPPASTVTPPTLRPFPASSAPSRRPPATTSPQTASTQPPSTRPPPATTPPVVCVLGRCIGPPR